MPFKVENEVDFMYGSEESNQPVFKVKSRLGFKSRYRSAIKLEIITSQENSALNPMIEIPLTACTQVDKWRMQKLENENILRHYEIKSNRLIMYLSDLQKGERLNFAVSLSNNLQGEFTALSGEYYEYFNKELLGVIKIPTLQF